MKAEVTWFEIPANNFERAVKFYEEVFSVKLIDLSCNGEMMACFPGGDGKSPGAVIAADGYEPSENGIIISFDAGPNLNETLRTVESSGGKVVMPKTKIEAEGRGYFAIFTDTEGNRLGLYSDK